MKSNITLHFNGCKNCGVVDTKKNKWPGFEKEVQKRGEIGARYSKLLKDRAVVPSVSDGNTHVYAQYTIRVDEGRRDEIVAGMKDAGIPVGVYYPKCFHEQPVFEHLGYEYGDFLESEKASREVLSLSMHPFLTEEQQKEVTDKLLSLL